MTFHTRVSGTWREIRFPTANIAGVNRSILFGYTKVGGTWRTFFVRDNTGPVVPTPSVSWNQGIPGFTITYGATTDAISTVSSVVLERLLQGGSWTNIGSLVVGGGSTNNAIASGNRGQTVGYRIIGTDSVGNVTIGSEVFVTAKPQGSFGLAAVDNWTWAQFVGGHGSGSAGWRNSVDLHSGRWDAGTYGHQVGLWFYGTGIADICKGYAPDVASLGMYRNNSYGSAGFNNIAPHAHTAKPVTPVIDGGTAAPGPYPHEDPGPSLFGSDAWSIYQLPSSWMALMGNGTLKGIATVDSGNPPGDQGSSGSYRVLYGLLQEGLSGFLTILFN